ncbi:MAG: CBS domain-containing protein [Anaerolineae bacterium]
MTREVQTLGADAPIAEGLRLMNDRTIHRLPVIDAAGDLLGIVSDMDLRIAEAAGRLGDPVSTVMTRRVVTVSEYCPLEEAASIMRHKGIGGLPVVRGAKLIGIITDGDIFDMFARLLGVGLPGVRLTVTLPADPHVLLDLLQGIQGRGGEVVALGTIRRNGGSLVVIKVTGIPEQMAQDAVRVVGAEVSDVLSEGPSQ